MVSNHHSGTKAVPDAPLVRLMWSMTSFSRNQYEDIIVIISIDRKVREKLVTCLYYIYRYRHTHTHIYIILIEKKYIYIYILLSSTTQLKASELESRGPDVKDNPFKIPA